MKKIKRVYHIIFKSINDEIYNLVNYEEIVTNPKALNEFLKRIGLNELSFKDINNLNLRNENLKYYI